MPAPFHLLLGAAAIFAMVRAPLRHATVGLLVVLVLVPTTLPLPVGPVWIGLSRLVLWAYVLGLVIRVRRGEIPADAFRPTRVHVALAAFLGIAFVAGLILPPQPHPRFDALRIWLTMFDQFVALVAVLAAARLLDPWWLARLLVGLAAGLGLIAVAERYFDANWAQWWFESRPGHVPLAARRLSERGEAIRVRGPSQFALEFGWVCAVLLPVAVAVVSRARHLLVRAVPGLLALAVVWSVSRSATIAMGIGLALFLLLSRLDRRVLVLVAAGGAIAGIVFLQNQTVAEPFGEASVDSADSRVRRFVLVADEVSERPLVGLGLAGLRARDVLGTDTSYVLMYGLLGIIGVAAFGIMLVTAVLSVTGGLRGPPSDERTLTAAIVAALVTGLMGAAFFDHFTVPGASRLWWTLAAIGLTITEETLVRGPAGVPAAGPVRRSRWRVALPAAGVVLGIGVLAVAPRHVASKAEFEVVEIPFHLAAPKDPKYVGRVMINTTCQVLNSGSYGDAHIDCREPREASTIGRLRITAPDRDTVTAASRTVLSRLERFMPTVQVIPVERLERGTPTWARTAPVWLGMAGVALAVLVPPVRWRERFGQAQQGVRRALERVLQD